MPKKVKSVKNTGDREPEDAKYARETSTAVTDRDTCENRKGVQYEREEDPWTA